MNSKGKYGMDLGTGNLGGQIELMSESTKSMTVYLTMYMEWVPKSTPGYKPATHIWMDVTDCGISFFPAQKGSYVRKSKEVVVKEDGELVFVYGHMHDGGIKTELLNNGKVVCTSKQMYANRRGGYVEPPNSPDIIKAMIMPQGSHISDVGVCKDFAKVKKGDKLQVIGYYDDSAHAQMKNPEGRLEGQMAIAQTYLGITG
jgi:stress up-regulated protein Nod 19